MIDKTRIKPYSLVENKIYAYSLPDLLSHKGYIKVGQTTKSVEERIDQQLSILGIKHYLHWKKLAQRNDLTWFSDKDLHRYYDEKGFHPVIFKSEGSRPTEWFDFGEYPEKSEELANEYINIDQYAAARDEQLTYILRPEQDKAVEMTLAYYERSKNSINREFLWNAKPRFGKTLSSYDFMRKISAKNTLIVTNRPAIANSWLDDFNKFIGWQEENLYFISNTSSINKKAYTRQEFVEEILPKNHDAGMVAFISFQDLKGGKIFGGKYDKLEWIAGLGWDLLIIDESHEGVDTLKTDKAFDKIDRDFTLHLSGTPFKALAEEKFEADQIYNWTYLDEQISKEKWERESPDTNPYASLPSLSLFTYQMSQLIVDKVQEGMAITEDINVDYAFDLNEFFSTKENGEFVHEKDVIRFLDNLSKGHMPFSETKHRDELRHSFWLLPGVAPAKALEGLLKKHPIFKDYKTILAAGDGISLDQQRSVDEIIELEAYNQKATEKSYDRVKKAIKENEKTITLSCGQLTTGVTIPQWTGVLMLNNIASPALYFQAAFRAQNPHKFENKDGKLFRKERAYIFDFAPDRTLQLYDALANNLSGNLLDITGKDREENIRLLLNFFPVIAEDDQGKMIELAGGEQT